MEEIIILPGEYQQVEYIESHGEEYINTGIKANSNIKMEVTLINPDMSDGDDHTLCGGGVAWGEQYLQLQCRLNSMCSYGDNWDRVDFHGGNITTICQDKNNFYQDGELLSTFSSQQFNTNYDIHIFCAAQSNVPAEFSSFKVAAFKIYNDNNLVRDFVACVRVTDGEAGLYDLVTETFYANEGSGAFTYPDTPVDNRLSQNLERIRNAVDGIRETLNMPDASIEELEESVVIPPSGTIDINSNGITDVASYEYANVNVSNLKKKDVNFYDYDGTLTNSYTKAEFLALESLPTNPSHEGLVAQGWNWSLADAKTYVTNYNKLNIGQMYDTDDGMNKIHVTLQEDWLSPYLCVTCPGTITIDWGDGSAPEIASPQFSTIKALHNYAHQGSYVIKFKPNDNAVLTIQGVGYNQGKQSQILRDNDQNSTSYYYKNIPYLNGITEINVSSNNTRIGGTFLANCYNIERVSIPQSVNITSLGVYSFQNCDSLKFITIPSGVTLLDSYCFYYCTSLENISLPSTLTSLGGYCFYLCRALENITLPSTLTTIDTYCFANCYSLKHITLPSTLTNLGSGCFHYCRNLKTIALSDLSIFTTITGNTFYHCESVVSIKIPATVLTIWNDAFAYCYSATFFDFSNHTSIPDLKGSAFMYMPNTCKIIVPDNLYEDWIAASYWSNYSDNIIKKSDWDGGNE